MPHMIVRVPPKGPISYDLNLHFDYSNVFGIGAGYRNSDALIAFVSFKIRDQFMIIYSFDYTISQLGISTGGAHEVSIRYEFFLGDPRKPPKNVRQIPCPKF